MRRTGGEAELEVDGVDGTDFVELAGLARQSLHLALTEVSPSGDDLLTINPHGGANDIRGAVNPHNEGSAGYESWKTNASTEADLQHAFGGLNVEQVHSKRVHFRVAAVHAAANEPPENSRWAGELLSDDPWRHLQAFRLRACCAEEFRPKSPAGRQHIAATLTYTYDRPSTGTPEPASWALMLLGFAGLGAELRRRRGQVVLAA